MKKSLEKENLELMNFFLWLKQISCFLFMHRKNEKSKKRKKNKFKFIETSLMIMRVDKEIVEYFS